MFNKIAVKEAQGIVGGSVGGPLYICHDKRGNVYYDNKPNSAGCLNWSTQQMEKGSGKGSAQRK